MWHHPLSHPPSTCAGAPGSLASLPVWVRAWWPLHCNATNGSFDPTVATSRRALAASTNTIKYTMVFDNDPQPGQKVTHSRGLDSGLRLAERAKFLDYSTFVL